jgi:hypothetical protein
MGVGHTCDGKKRGEEAGVVLHRGILPQSAGDGIVRGQSVRTHPPVLLLLVREGGEVVEFILLLIKKYLKD